MFERRDVWTLSDKDPWHPTLEWYARAVRELRTRPAADPTSWEYLASIHGTRAAKWPAGATWGLCEHDNWFFLPWHRVYLHYFETVVRLTVRALGGPDDWSLPYWDYSDAAQPNARRIPPAFLKPRLPSGEENPLFTTERDPRMNAGGELAPGAVNVTDALRLPVFEVGVGRAGFGGVRPPAKVKGALENVPHGSVHNGVAGPRGWMGAFATAGLDPVFWLHHANVDRLWEVWRGMGRADPPDTAWRDASFTIGQGAHAVTLAARDVVDTSRPPLGYRYSSVAPPAGAGGAPGIRFDTKSLDFDTLDVGAGDTPEVGARTPDVSVPAEMVGASDRPIALGATPSEVRFAVAAPRSRGTKSLNLDITEAAEPEVFLKVENVRGHEVAAGGYVVFVNLPAGESPDAHPERRAGEISMFGVREASDADGEHGGDGITFSLEITEVARALEAAGDWDTENIRVTFVPVQRGPEDEVVDGDVRVGRVSVFAT